MSEPSKTHDLGGLNFETAYDQVEHTTRCKHGWGDCVVCGTSDRRDVIHVSRTPDKRTARRQRRRGK